MKKILALLILISCTTVHAEADKTSQPKPPEMLAIEAAKADARVQRALLEWTRQGLFYTGQAKATRISEVCGVAGCSREILVTFNVASKVDNGRVQVNPQTRTVFADVMILAIGKKIVKLLHFDSCSMEGDDSLSDVKPFPA